jgi:uncharacterized membrane protein YciS (DUF1049 family)
MILVIAMIIGFIAAWIFIRLIYVKKIEIFKSEKKRKLPARELVIIANKKAELLKRVREGKDILYYYEVVYEKSF